MRIRSLVYLGIEAKKQDLMAKKICELGLGHAKTRNCFLFIPGFLIEGLPGYKTVRRPPEIG
jgi:hypothetical protein